MRLVSRPRVTSTQCARPCSARSVGMRRARAYVHRLATFSSTRRLSTALSTTVVTLMRSTASSVIVPSDHPLVGARHAEHVLAHVRGHEIVVDGRGPVEAGLAELALDVVLLGEAVAAVAVDA